MAIKNSTAVYIDGKNVSANTVLPLKIGNFLDERLDECQLSLRGVNKEHFTPLTPVEIVVKNKRYWGMKNADGKTTEKTYHFVVANDSASEMQIGKGLYNHDLYLVEVTKAAECFVVDTITFTNDLGRFYAEESNASPDVRYNTMLTSANVTESTGNGYTIKSGVSAGNIYIPSFGQLNRFRWVIDDNSGGGGTSTSYDVPNRIFVYKSSDYKVRTEYQAKSILDPSGPVVARGENGNIRGESLNGFFVNLEAGSYIIEYTYLMQEVVFNAVGQPSFRIIGAYCCTYYFTVVENKLPLKEWTITDVIERTLDLTETLRKGEKARFKLNTAQEGQFDKILAPQFSFTKQTLRECLQDVGKVIHGEPRLTPKKDTGGWFYEVSYDMYASQERSGIYALPYIKKDVSQVVDSYATYLDSNAENLVNQLDKFSGVIVEPYRGGARTVRTENLYVRIEGSNMLIPTQYPIYTVEKLEYVYTQDGAVKVVDITPYLFEKSVYNSRLSSYDEQYPYSKAYGLYYSQGNKNIGGLNFHVDAAVFSDYKNYAITNILRSATNSSGGFNSDYPKMAFRVTYTPFYNARVAQTKPNYKDFSHPAALIYNQASNVIESRYYGENLKGAIARIGNVEKSLTYLLYRIEQIPQAGQIFDKDYYISVVTAEILPTVIKCTIGLSKDFNRLSAYIGINSEKRYSEISQNQAVERNTLWREYIVVGTQETPDRDCLIGNKMLGAIADTFCLQEKTERFDHGIAPLNSSPEPYKFGVVYTVEINGELINAELTSEADGGSDDYYLVLENSTASGTGRVMISFSKILYPLSNVCAWGTSYKGTDVANGVAINLPVISSAFGNSISFSWRYADNYSAGDMSVYEANAFTSDDASGYFQNSASYTDYYGRMYYYNFDLQAEGPTVTADNVTTLGLALPNGTKPTQTSGFVSTIGQQPLVMRKDNREALQCNFQIDFVTNLENLIIGSALASYCPAVRGRDNTLTAKLYVFDTELNKFTDHVEAYENVDLEKMDSAEVSVDMYDGYFTVSAGRLPKTESGATSGKSWAIITNQYKKPAVQVEDEFGNVSEQQEVMGGDLLIGQNIAVTAGQAFTPIYFTKKREIFDKTVWKDRL